LEAPIFHNARIILLIARTNDPATQNATNPIDATVGRSAIDRAQFHDQQQDDPIAK
jgi:hypothetical protein